MNALDISVIIPSRDRNDKVLATIHSLLNGSVLPDEVIIVDDGSVIPVGKSIESKEIISSFPFELKIVRHEKSLGASAARNKGAKIAKSNLLVFLDDDTLASKGLIASHVRHHLRDSGNHSLAMGRLIFHPKIKLTRLHDWMENRANFKEISAATSRNNISGGFISANFSVLAESFSKTGGFDESFPFNRNEDTNFGIRAREIGGLSLDLVTDALAFHDSEIDLVAFVKTVFQGGISKAYWSLNSAGDTAECKSFIKVLYTWKNRQKLEEKVSDWVASNMRLAESSHVSEPFRHAFESELRDVVEIVKNLGLAYGWLYFSPSANRLFDTFDSKASGGGGGELLRFGFSGFDPALHYLVRQTIISGNLQAAEELCMLRKSNPWNDLALCLIQRLLGKKMPETLSERIRCRATSGVAIHELQLTALERIQDMDPTSKSPDLRIINQIFGVDFDNLTYPKSWLGPTSWSSRARSSMFGAKTNLFRSLIFKDSIRQLSSYQWRSDNIFSAQRMNFYASRVLNRYFVELVSPSKQRADEGQREPRAEGFLVTVEFMESVGWQASSLQEEWVE